MGLTESRDRPNFYQRTVARAALDNGRATSSNTPMRLPNGCDESVREVQNDWPPFSYRAVAPSSRLSDAASPGGRF
jgi:hypothetical protein